MSDQAHPIAGRRKPMLRLSPSGLNDFPMLGIPLTPLSDVAAVTNAAPQFCNAIIGQWLEGVNHFPFGPGLRAWTPLRHWSCPCPIPSVGSSALVCPARQCGALMKAFLRPEYGLSGRDAFSRLLRILDRVHSRRFWRGSPRDRGSFSARSRSTGRPTGLGRCRHSSRC